MNDNQKIIVAMLFGPHDETKTREETLKRLEECVRLASTLNSWVVIGIPEKVSDNDRI